MAMVVILFCAGRDFGYSVLVNWGLPSLYQGAQRVEGRIHIDTSTSYGLFIRVKLVQVEVKVKTYSATPDCLESD